MFNLNSGHMSISESNINSFKKYQYKQYIQTLYISNDCLNKISSDKENKIENLKSLYNQISTECIHLTKLGISNSNTQLEPIKLKLISLFTSDVPTAINLTELDLHCTTYNGKINCNTFPKSLTNLKLPSKFSHEIKANVLPSNLKSLFIGTEYKLALESNVLPISLEKLTFENRIDIPFSIDSLSYLINLKEIIFLSTISQSFPNGVFPDSVTELQFIWGICKTQQFDREWLPKNLKSISIGGSNQYIFSDNSFPDSLTSISFHNIFCSTIAHLPDSIKTLKNYSSNLSLDYIKNDPTTHSRVYNLLLEHKESNQLESILTTPVFFDTNSSSFYDSCEDSWSKLLKIQKLPTDNYTITQKTEKKKSSFINLYDQIEFLCIGMPNWFNRSTFFKLIFPHSIRVLIIANGYYLNKDSNGNIGSVPIILPPNLEILCVGIGPGQCISSLELPKTLRVLSILSNPYSLPIPIQYIPTCLKTLFIRGFRYRNPGLLSGDINQLPQSLQSIYFNEDLSYSIDFYYPTHHHLLFKVSYDKLDQLFNKLVKDTLYL